MAELLEAIPAMEEMIKEKDHIKSVVSHLVDQPDAFFIGRGLDYALSLEGALKLKEISYIHAEAYAAGELKHGTIALIADRVPVIAIATQSGILSKMLSNVREVKARGAFVGLSAMHGRGDLIRAVMEGVSYSQRQCLDILREMGVAPDHIMACGGGGRSPFWRQMLADVLGCTVQTAKAAQEGPALGVAILAGVGAGLYPSVQEACDVMIQTNQPQNPIAENVPQYESFYQVYKSLYPALKENFKLLTKAE